MMKLPEIPGYRIIKKLGQGGMADVFLGIQEKLQRQVAIKIMIPSLFRDEQFSKRFLKEAQTAAQLNHPNIITIHDVGETEDTHYIVMEYLEESLSQRLSQRGALPPAEALNTVKMIAGALDYAHKKGFIHRDIKPDNIMFRSDGTVVLVDFGIARAIDSTTHLTRTGMSIGTPHYMSPEQCKGDKIDGRSDIYSLGVQLYELLTGEVPYRAENTAGIIIKHIQDPVPLLPSSLSRYQPLIYKAMAKDKNQRIQTGAELIKFIDGYLTAREFLPPPLTRPETSTIRLDVPTLRTPVPSTTPVSFLKTSREKKKWLVPGLIAAAAVILFGVLLYVITREPVKDKDVTVPPVQGTPATGETQVAGTTQGTQEKQTPSGKPKDTTQTGPTPTKVEPPPVTGKEKDSTEVTPKTRSPQETGSPSDKGKDAGKVKPGTGKKEITPPLEKPTPVEKKIDTREIKPGPEKVETGPIKTKPQETPLSHVSQVKTVNLLEVAPDLRQTYNMLVQRIQIPLLNARLRVHGQITLSLFINENGRVTVVSMSDIIEVEPAPRKVQVLSAIGRKMNNLIVPAPKDKDGNPVRFNWRVTFKVGQYMNKVFLVKE